MGTDLGGDNTFKGLGEESEVGDGAVARKDGGAKDTDDVQRSWCSDNLLPLQRSRTLDRGVKESLGSKSVWRTESGLGTSTVCSSLDGTEDTNVAEGLSLAGGLNEPGGASAGGSFGGRGEPVSKGRSIESVSSEEGAESHDQAGFCSEEDVLNFTFKVCDTEEIGRIPASVIVQYLQEMTGQSCKHGRLHALYNMLDPDRRDVAVDRESFKSTMRKWIANCSQDGETNELINDIADLKYANQKLQERNLSLQKAMEMSDETNLQLMKELSKLKDQLTSSQRTLRSVKSMAEDLDDATSTVRDSQEKIHHLQTHCKELKKENEDQVAQLWAVFEKNEKIEREKRQLKYRIDELLTENADLTKQIHEAQNLLISKDALIFEEIILIEELKVSNAESCKMIEGLRAELKKSQGKICQDFFSCKIGLSKPSPGVPLVFPPRPQTSLQSEIQESQKQAQDTEGLPDPVCGLMTHKEQGDLFQEIFSHIKAERHSTLFQSTVDEMVEQLNVQAEAFMASLQRIEPAQQLNLKELKKELKQTMLAVVQKIHLLAPIKESWDQTMEGLERACAECQQQYVNTKHNLANT
ncbi:inositol 1,4,5-triphosphate receptor associated 2-like [Heptranchias perlo]|uniref:inositol 1,4,5-triphosphate receptor associated 2-like n=1 Tax=Heptranchias perlo TaxID=212740 RepID=UPI00355A55BF